MVDHSRKSGVTFSVISAHSNFSEDIQTEKMVDRSGQLDERNRSTSSKKGMICCWSIRDCGRGPKRYRVSRLRKETCNTRGNAEAQRGCQTKRGAYPFSDEA